MDVIFINVVTSDYLDSDVFGYLVDNKLFYGVSFNEASRLTVRDIFS